MPSGIQKREANRYDAVYEQPWGGVASNADASDIAPNQFVTGDGVILKDGNICSAGWNLAQVVNFGTPAGTKFMSGLGGVKIRTILLPASVSPTPTYKMCFFTDQGTVYTYDTTSDSFLLDQTMTPMPAAGNTRIYAIQVIAGVAYVSLFDDGSIYAYTPSTSYVKATGFVGGKYITEIVGYLIVANTNQPTDVGVGTFPIKFNRYNWSAPFGYTTWDPGIDRTAGFNTISEVQDEITQLFCMGNVGYVLRDQGISQLSPTNIGVEPFDVTPLWESIFGIGCTYPDSFAQYGTLAIWANDNDIYAFFSGSVPQSISGVAKSAIYTDINTVLNPIEMTLLSGAFFNSGENSINPDLYYGLCIAHAFYFDSVMPFVIWTLNISTKSWTRQKIDFFSIIKNLLPATTQVSINRIELQGVLYPAVNSGGVVTVNKSGRKIIGIVAVWFQTDSDVGGTIMLPLFYSDKGEAVVGHGDIALFNLLFKQEEIRLGAKPTVRSVIVKANGKGTLHITVSGKAFSDIVMPGAGASRTHFSYGEVTEENPQLSITSTDFEGVVIKANMNITYDEGSPT